MDKTYTIQETKFSRGYCIIEKTVMLHTGTFSQLAKKFRMECDADMYCEHLLPIRTKAPKTARGIVGALNKIEKRCSAECERYGSDMNFWSEYKLV